jgi:hypothetical protein
MQMYYYFYVAIVKLWIGPFNHYGIGFWVWRFPVGFCPTNTCPLQGILR